MPSIHPDHQCRTADVVIIGGGVIGLSIARALVRRALREIIIIERGSMGKEASSAAAGMLAPQAEANHADEFFYLACRSRDMYPAFAAELLEESGIDVELDKTGTLYLAFSEADEHEIEQRRQWQSSAGLTVEKLTTNEANFLEPCLSAEVRSALRFPGDIQVENRRLIAALCEANYNLGIHLLPGTTASEVVEQNGRVLGVETSLGFISAPRVVLAAGAWTSSLRIAGKEPPRIRIEPVRGQMLCFSTNRRMARHVIYSPRGYLVPRADGRLLAGSTSEVVGFDKRVTAAGMHSILTRTLEISPAVLELPLLDHWAGLRPKAPDGLPVIGPCAEIDGLFVASGHYRNGILLAPLTAELLADIITDGVIPPEMQSFVPERLGELINN
ncbi:MAG TPA: glycine oxidase ThiO [Pyrinomonadaceae bacterium]|nr:glycine oxidase ThiO [Pyrinomonadaceae bacterium]